MHSRSIYAFVQWLFQNMHGGVRDLVFIEVFACISYSPFKAEDDFPHQKD